MVCDPADRLFRNDDLGTFVEVLQNSRRAAATLVEVGIDEVQGSSARCVVTILDNGTGIRDFEQLLTLGDSGWSTDTQTTEDPAGMGFYSLCLSGVEVYSGNQYTNISPAAFLGKADAIIERRQEFLRGTRLRFTRPSSQGTLAAALANAAQFYPLEVRLNGEALPRHDFLEGAVHRELIDGIEVGFATRFAHDWSYYGEDKNWNFYGAQIKQSFPQFYGILPEDPQRGPLSLHARFNVLETGRIKLQLPDRRSIIENDFLGEFYKKARAAAYRCFQKQPRHVLSFKNWKEAKELGVDLLEAASLLTTWSALASETDSNQMFGDDKASIISNLNRAMLVDRDLTNTHTLQGGLYSGAKLDYDLYREHPDFAGYSWYEALPRLVNVEVTIDGSPAQEYLSKQQNARPSKIELGVTIRESGRGDHIVALPALIHVDSDELNSPCFVAVEQSPWDNDQLAGPFAVDEFLIYATFSPSDEGDTWQTQMDYYEGEVERVINEYFRGPRASLVALLHKGLRWDAADLASRLNVSQIKLTRDQANKSQWDIQLIGSDGQMV